MVKRSFAVRAIWDEKAEVFYSESDIVGLHIEVVTLDEFEAVMMELGPELIVSNHYSKPDLGRMTLADLIHAIFWQRPAEQHTLA